VDGAGARVRTIFYCQILSQQLEGSHALFRIQMADFLAALAGPMVRKWSVAALHIHTSTAYPSSDDIKTLRVDVQMADFLAALPGALARKWSMAAPRSQASSPNSSQASIATADGGETGPAG